MTSDINGLYHQVLTGDKDAVELMFSVLRVSFRLFVRHRIVNGQDGEEIVQDALTTIAEKYRSVQIESSFAGWAHQVLSNKILDYYKFKRVRSGVAASPEATEAESPDAVEDPTLKARLLDCLKRIHGANSFHARALNLHYQGYDTREICTKLGITPNNFYVMLSRARTMLRICLERGEIGQ